jgi:hypothetical protein
MPNTLAHVGVQGLVSSLAWKDVDLKWVYVGCVVPDFPWILQRAVVAFAPSVDPFTLRYYVDFQASLLGCLVLCGMIAAFAGAYWKTLLILGSNSVLHLVLDASQIKWANGVHFMAPASWHMSNWGFFWPESILGVVLTILGLVVLSVKWRTSVGTRPGLVWPCGRRALALPLLGSAYLLLPLVFLATNGRGDNHSLETLLDGERVGEYVEFDRAHVLRCGDQWCIEGPGGEYLEARELMISSPATVSVRGVFVEDNVVLVTDHHVHLRWYRDGASYLALLLICMTWILSFFVPRDEQES